MAIPQIFSSISWGLRQGDLISPCLFVLVTEALSSLIVKAEQGRFIGDSSFTPSICRWYPFFYEDDVDQLKYWKWTVICFKLVSGLKINLQKGEIIPVGETKDVNRATSLFGSKVGKVPTSYLGLPLISVVVHRIRFRRDLKGNWLLWKNSTYPKEEN